jgi:hypothetical protein
VCMGGGGGCITCDGSCHSPRRVLLLHLLRLAVFASTYTINIVLLMEYGYMLSGVKQTLKLRTLFYVMIHAVVDFPYHRYRDSLTLGVLDMMSCFLNYFQETPPSAMWEVVDSLSYIRRVADSPHQ